MIRVHNVMSKVNYEVFCIYIFGYELECFFLDVEFLHFGLSDGQPVLESRDEVRVLFLFL